MLANGLSGWGQQHDHSPGHHSHAGQTSNLIKSEIPAQPLIAQATRLTEALAYLGSPLSPEDANTIKEISLAAHDSKTAERIQQVLDPYCIAQVNINPESRVKVERGAAKPLLMQGGWTSFLVKVHNEGMVTAQLEVESPNALDPYNKHSWGYEVHPDKVVKPGEMANRFLDAQMFRGKPLNSHLSGFPLEYAVVQLYSKDAGMRDVEIGFNVGQSTQDIGFRNTVNILFQIAPAVKLIFDVKDDDGTPVMGSFIITDSIDRAPGKLATVYPLPSRRVADTDTYPDFFFQQQVYRQTGEHVLLPPGKFTVKYSRGPEYIPLTKNITVPEGVDSVAVGFQLKRWINLSKLGWYSSDHHVHASGCSHYNSPVEGVRPQDMWRQAAGEALNISALLSWGPGWYFQKNYFTGKEHELSTSENILRYDVEVSGFPSSHAGHLVLLQLQEDDYPGTERVGDWPSWTLPILKWAKAQGAITGYAHSGDGLAPLYTTNLKLHSKVTDKEKFHAPVWRTYEEFVSTLPNYITPKMDGIGANEYVVTAAHGLVDFYSAGNTPINWELNMWYHTLNAGMKIPISGETDFPCVADERIGYARSYFKADGPLSYSNFIQSIKNGRSYVSDGFSHILNFSVNGVESGTQNSLVNITKKQKVTVKADVAAYLPAVQTEDGKVIAKSSLVKHPFWNIERARMGTSRQVKVELLVNGEVAETKQIEADGNIHAVQFSPEINRSSWLALRIFASSHSNPVYVELNKQPVMVKESVEWCIEALDQCWTKKEPQIREQEKQAAAAAYQEARRWYEKKLANKK